MSLNNIPVYDTQKERENYVHELARRLPDPTIELIYTAEEEKAGSKGSRHFTVRTSEREPEIVQASLDQLLRESTARLPVPDQPPPA